MERLLVDKGAGVYLLLLLVDKENHGAVKAEVSLWKIVVMFLQSLFLYPTSIVICVCTA